MSNKTLTLSIVIPAYNEEGYLPACLDSIAAQTVMPDEVIVVDNNSTDQTAAIAKQYPFVKIIKEKRQGVVFARNRGFDTSRSVIIARIDADTILLASWVKDIRTMYREAGSPQVFAITAPSNFRNKFSLLCYFLHRLTYFWPSRLLLGHMPFVGSNMVITRKLWIAVRPDVCLRTDIHEDMDLAYHIAKRGVRISFSTKLKGSVLARKMLARVLSYPMMMLRIKLISH